MNLVRKGENFRTSQLLTIDPGTIYAAHILHHDVIAITENTTMFAANILLWQHNLVTHLLSHAADDNGVALGCERPLCTLIVANNDTNHNFSPKY